jgi:hypothetical protein
MTLPTASEVQSWPGLPVHDASDVVLGVCRSVFGDSGTGLPEWIEVELTADGLAFVPVPGAEVRDGVLHVTQEGRRVAESPRFSGGRLSRREERELYAHYGIEASEDASASVLPTGTAGTGTVPPVEPAAPTPPLTPPLIAAAVPATPAAPAPPADPVAPVEPPLDAPPAPAAPVSRPTPLPVAAPPSPGSSRRLPVLLAGAAAAAGALQAVRARRRPAVGRRRAGQAALLLAPLAAGLAGVVLQRRRPTPLPKGVGPTVPVDSVGRPG